MKKLLIILLFVNISLFGQENSPCSSDENIFNQMENINPTITKNFVIGWNMFGYTCYEPIDLSIAFTSIYDKIRIVKDNSGNVYMPEFSFNGIGLLEGGEGYQIKLSDIVHNFSFCNGINWVNIYGCTDCNALNYNQWVNQDDGSCNYDTDGDGINDTDEIEGCTDYLACNYDSSSTTETDNDLCIYPDGICESCSGDQDGTGIILDNDADNDGVCNADDVFPNDPTEWLDSDEDGLGDNEDIVLGCTDVTACNYNASVTVNSDNSNCVFILDACATCSGDQDGTGTLLDNDLDDDGVCDENEIEGCTDYLACNYDARLTTDENIYLCIYSTDLDLCATCSGEQDGTGIIVDNDSDDDGVCDENEFYCPYPGFFEYAPEAINYDPELCQTPIIEGCTSNLYLEFNPDANFDDDSCLEIIILGCTDSLFVEYNSSANLDDGTCNVIAIYGCVVPAFPNYNSVATVDDGSCDFNSNIIYGCSDSEACNYNPDVTIDNQDCDYPVLNFDCEGNSLFELGDRVKINTVTGSISVINSWSYQDGFEEGYITHLSNNYVLIGRLSQFQTCLLNEGYSSSFFPWTEINLDPDTWSVNYYPNNNTAYLNIPGYTLDGYYGVGSCEGSSYIYHQLSINDDNHYTQENIYTYQFEYSFGCTDETAYNYSPSAIIDNNSCLPVIYGCKNSDAANFSPQANTDNGSCEIYGCLDDNYLEYDHLAEFNDGSCQTFIVEGCTDIAASNFNPDANLDNGMCINSCNESTITVGGGTYQEEVSWQITDEVGIIILEGGVGNFDYCFYRSTIYTLNMFDTYGDGWNGNSFVINNILDVTLDDGYNNQLVFYVP